MDSTEKYLGNIYFILNKVSLEHPEVPDKLNECIKKVAVTALYLGRGYVKEKLPAKTTFDV